MVNEKRPERVPKHGGARHPDSCAWRFIDNLYTWEQYTGTSDEAYFKTYYKDDAKTVVSRVVSIVQRNNDDDRSRGMTAIVLNNEQIPALEPHLLAVGFTRVFTWANYNAGHMGNECALYVIAYEPLPANRAEVVKP